MNRTEPVRQVATRSGLGAAEADALARGEAIRFPGFGTFAGRDRPARTGRNPQTGVPLALPASRSVSFRPARALRDAVRRCGA